MSTTTILIIVNGILGAAMVDSLLRIAAAATSVADALLDDTADAETPADAPTAMPRGAGGGGRR